MYRSYFLACVQWIYAAREKHFRMYLCMYKNCHKEKAFSCLFWWAFFCFALFVLFVCFVYREDHIEDAFVFLVNYLYG